MENRGNYRSLFWPVVLIGAGVLWLLSNLGYVSFVQVVDLWRLWPVLLILAGIDLLFGRRVPLVGAFFGLVVVALVAYVLAFGMPIRVNADAQSQAQVVTETYATPIDQATSANVTLDFWSDPVSIHTLTDSQNVIDARITHTGNVNFSGSGDTVKTIRLSHSENPFNIGWWFNPERRTDVGLTTRIPLDLRVDTGSGSSQMDLSGLQLSSFSLDSGSGSVDLTLPGSAVPGTTSINSGSGSVNIKIPQGAAFTLETDTGSGSLHIRVPAGTALKIDSRDDGSGSLSLPSGLTQTRSGSRDTGTWESTDYATAAQKVTITIASAGSGSISIDR
jgi:hypothetical protein